MRGVWITAFVLACAQAPLLSQFPPLPAFEGPGRLLLIFERDAERELFVVDPGAARRVAIEAPREARFVHAEELLVVVEVPADEEFRLPKTELRIVELATGRQTALGPPGRHYDPEPSPDGRWLAVGAETAGVGDSDLEIWSLGERERIATRPQSFEEPRWRHDGVALVASVLMSDPESDEDSGGGMLGTSFSWPRLHRLRRDLGEPVFLWDGDESASLAPGGSLPLWWDESGIFARQRRGLVRCDAIAGSCAMVYAPERERRVVDGRKVGVREAWLLTVAAVDAFDRRQPDEIVRVDLATSQVLGRWRAQEGTVVIEIDWIERGHEIE
jgi:hypothetical protein